MSVQVLRSFGRGTGPLVAVVHNLCAISLQMAIRAHFARRALRRSRALAQARMGITGIEDVSQISVASQSSQKNPQLLEVHARTRALHDGLEAVEGRQGRVGRESQEQQRLSAAVAVFVGQIRNMLAHSSPQSPDSHRRRILDAVQQREGPLARTIQQLSAVALQAVVRGHQSRQRVSRWTQAVDHICSWRTMSTLSLSRAIALGRQLFAFQEQRFGGMHTFYTAVCSGRGFLSDVIRHACCVAIQCAFRARTARAIWSRHASEALEMEVAGTKPSGRPWYKYTRARLTGEAPVDGRSGRPNQGRTLKKIVARTPPAQESVPQREVKYKWNTMAPATGAEVVPPVNDNEVSPTQQSRHVNGSEDVDTPVQAHKQIPVRLAREEGTGRQAGDEQELDEHAGAEAKAVSSGTEYESSEGRVSSSTSDDDGEPEEWMNFVADEVELETLPVQLDVVVEGSGNREEREKDEQKKGGNGEQESGRTDVGGNQTEEEGVSEGGGSGGGSQDLSLSVEDSSTLVKDETEATELDESFQPAEAFHLRPPSTPQPLKLSQSEDLPAPDEPAAHVPLQIESSMQQDQVLVRHDAGERASCLSETVQTLDALSGSLPDGANSGIPKSLALPEEEVGVVEDQRMPTMDAKKDEVGVVEDQRIPASNMATVGKAETDALDVAKESRGVAMDGLDSLTSSAANAKVMKHDFPVRSRQFHALQLSSPLAEVRSFFLFVRLAWKR